MTREQKELRAEQDYDRAKDEAAERHGDDIAVIRRHEYDAHWFMHQNDPKLALIQYQKIVDRLTYAYENSRWSTSRMPEGTHERGYLSEYHRLRKENHRLRKENKRLRDALEEIRECAELRGPSMRLSSLEHIEEIVETTLQEDGDDTH